MQLQNLKSHTRRKTKKRVGRGGKRGTYAGRGLKGQKARSGRRIRPAERDIIKKIPKRRGYNARRFREKPEIVNLNLLESAYATGETVSPATLRQKGILRSKKTKIAVKLLGTGTITKKLLVDQCQLSQSAKQKITQAGGTIRE